MKYASEWKYQFSSDWKTALILSVVASGILAPIVTIATKRIIKKIVKR